MCLAAFALNAHPRFPLVIAANRDEFFARAAAPMGWWRSGAAEIMAGKDLSAGGTWLGLSRSGRFALLTNVREPGRQDPAAPSRGALVTSWLGSDLPADAFAAALPPGYNGFNLIAGDVQRSAWHWLSNRAEQPVALGAGVHGLSNAALDTPWPKTLALRSALTQGLSASPSADALAQHLFTALADTSIAPDTRLPDTGIGLARERALSPAFIRIPDPDSPERAIYGTRCSTVLISERQDGVTLTRVFERTVSPLGELGPVVEHRLMGWPHNPPAAAA
jgi:uncharacterized protein with NRDE domain